MRSTYFWLCLTLRSKTSISYSTWHILQMILVIQPTTGSCSNIKWPAPISYTCRCEEYPILLVAYEPMLCYLLWLLVIVACDNLVGEDMRKCEQCTQKDSSGVSTCLRCISGYALSDDGTKCLGMYLVDILWPQYLCIIIVWEVKQHVPFQINNNQNIWLQYNHWKSI